MNTQGFSVARKMLIAMQILYSVTHVKNIHNIDILHDNGVKNLFRSPHSDNELQIITTEQLTIIIYL